LRLVAALGVADDADADGAAARAALRGALGIAALEAGPLGWPADAGDDALAIGRHRLRRLPGIDARHVAYLLDAPRLAFVGAPTHHRFDMGAMPADAILCHRVDVDGSAFTRQDIAAADGAQQLPPDALERFLRTNGDALLVDVRESFEAAAGALHLFGREARNLPLSRLAEHLEHLLAAPARPLIFVCRSGNRSARAALCLQRLGHLQAWTVAGGIALAG
jgi:cysteine desulfurase